MGTGSAPKGAFASPESAATAEACWQAVGAGWQAAWEMKPAPGWLPLCLVQSPGDTSMVGM